EEYHGALDDVQISDGEVRYLCQQVSRYFHRPVTPDQVIWSYAGVRPLLDDAQGNPSAVTRDYRLELDSTQAPLLTVWGGKRTTPRDTRGVRAAWGRAARRPGQGNRSGSFRMRSALPDRTRMGANGRRHPVAADQAGPGVLASAASAVASVADGPRQRE